MWFIIAFSTWNKIKFYIRASYVASNMQVVKRLIQLEFESPDKTRLCEFVVILEMMVNLCRKACMTRRLVPG